MWQYNYTPDPNELYHYGILGMKWGVRRYQNYDGSYTRAGMKRYNNSKEKYESARKLHKQTKELYKKGGTLPDGTKLVINKSVVKEAKDLEKSYKKQLIKDYKHLKQDKLADKGKKRYANGETITGHSNITSILASSGIVAAGGVQYLSKSGMMDKKVANIVSTASAVAVGASFVKRYVIDAPRDRELRAYYSHTSNY